MAEINFYLERSKENKKGQCPIIARLAFNGFKVKKSTGQRVELKFWNEERQRVRANEQSNYKIINPKITQVIDKYNSIINEGIANNIDLTLEYFDREWNSDGKTKIKNDLFKAYDQYIELHKSIRAQRTIKGHRTSYNFLKGYGETTKQKLTLEGFNLAEFEDLEITVLKIVVFQIITFQL